MPQGFLARVAGAVTQLFPTLISNGAADAGKIPGLGPDGRLDESLMPLGIGADTTQATVTEALSAGAFVNYHVVGGVFSVRLADNSNGRFAEGFVKEAFAEAEVATVYPIDGTNANMTALTVGSRYYLGTAGAVIATPLVETDPGNVTKVSQYLGVATSATELLTTDDGYVIL
ncbi:hypothetical protein [Aquipseudomonas campi]